MLAVALVAIAVMATVMVVMVPPTRDRTPRVTVTQDGGCYALERSSPETYRLLSRECQDR